MVALKEYLDPKGRSPFGRWLDLLDASAAAKVTVALTRLAQGNFSNVKGVGAGPFEYRIDFGPGIACTSGRTGRRSSSSSPAGRKGASKTTIETAQQRWADYKRRKSLEQ